MQSDEGDLEQQLLQQAVGGDRVATEHLLLRSYDRLLRHIRYRIPPDVQGILQAEDILQQTYVQVFRAIGEFEPRSPQSFYAWIKTIAERKLLDAQKRRTRERRRKQATKRADAEKSFAASVLNQVAVEEHSVSRPARMREAVSAMQIALASLPDDYRLAIRLRYVEGQSLEDVGKRVGRSEDAVRGLLHRAKRKLRDAMGRASAYLSTR